MYLLELYSLNFIAGKYLWRTDRTGPKASRHAALGPVRSVALKRLVLVESGPKIKPWEAERHDLCLPAAGSMLVSNLLKIDRWGPF